MPRLGQAARLRAHARRIGGELKRVLNVARDSTDLAHFIEEIRTARTPPPWSYSSSYGNHEREAYDVLPYGSLSMLITAHEDMRRDVESWDKDTDDRLIEETSEQIPDLGAMAWKLERIERGQDTGARHLTLDVDPLTIRVLAMVALEDDDSDEDDGNCVRDMYLEEVLALDERETRRRARHALQAMINKRGDGFLVNQSYSPENSDIPGLVGVSITILNGSVRTKISFNQTGVDAISSEAVQIGTTVSDAMQVAAIGEPIEKLVDHPLLTRLGLVVETIEERRNGEAGSCIRTDGWREKNLSAFVMNMGHDT